MFKLTYRTKNFKNEYKKGVEIFNDTKDLAETIYNITNNKKEAICAYNWSNRAEFGSKVTRQKQNYMVQCFSETALKDKIENNVVKEITNRLGISYKYIGIDPRNYMIWHIVDDNNIIVYDMVHNNYFVEITAIDPKTGESKVVHNDTQQDKDKFITNTVVAIEKLTREVVKNNVEKKLSDSDDKIVWHKLYASGKSQKSTPDDYLTHYYNDHSDVITISYDRNSAHNKIDHYFLQDITGSIQMKTNRLEYAKKQIELVWNKRTYQGKVV